MIQKAKIRAHHVSKWLAILPTFAAIIGIIVAWVMYMFKPSWPNKLIKSISPLYRFVLNNKVTDFLSGIICFSQYVLNCIAFSYCR